MSSQPYLLVMYQAMFAPGYYALMRVGELTQSQHTLKACNVHVAENNDKILLVLRSLKTHGKESYLQEIKIVANRIDTLGFQLKRNLSPFKLVRKYIQIRKLCVTQCVNESEQFFVFRDGTLVTATQAQALLKSILSCLNLDEKLYDMYSLRIG